MARKFISNHSDLPMDPLIGLVVVREGAVVLYSLGACIDFDFVQGAVAAKTETQHIAAVQSCVMAVRWVVMRDHRY